MPAPGFVHGPARVAAVATALVLVAAGGETARAPSSAIVLTAQASAAPGGADDFSSEPLGKFMNQKAMAHVRKLASDIGVRVRTTSGERKAARYVARKLEHYGYRTEIRKFNVDGAKSRNVVARWPGAMKFPVVLGAHIDTVPESPGANDNASGVGVMLEIARMAAGKEPAHFLKFVAFGSEEYGSNGRHHVGSRRFVGKLSDRGVRKMAGMVSVDMIADGRPLIIGTAGIGPDIVARTLYRKVTNAGIGATYEITCDCSDNGPFERAGIPGSFMWSGDEPNYHDPSDTVPNLKRRHVKRTGRAVKAFVEELDRKMIDKFREF